MSSNFYFCACPNCGKEMEVNEENRPYKRVYNSCLHCGFYSMPQTDFLTLEEVNSQREDMELDKIDKLIERNIELFGEEREIDGRLEVNAKAIAGVAHSQQLAIRGEAMNGDDIDDFVKVFTLELRKLNGDIAS